LIWVCPLRIATDAMDFVTLAMRKALSVVTFRETMRAAIPKPARKGIGPLREIATEKPSTLVSSSSSSHNQTSDCYLSLLPVGLTTEFSYHCQSLQLPWEARACQNTRRYCAGL